MTLSFFIVIISIIGAIKIIAHLEKATIQKETQIGVAAELAKVKFPETMIICGGDGKGNGANPFDAIGLKALYELSNSMSQQQKQQ